ncbi:zf-DHHC-domain-containing protein, partial [Hortaea werneckii]
MEPYKKVLVGILLISLVTFIALFGRLPALRRTPIGWLYRVLCLHGPSALKTIDRSTTGGRVTSRSKSLFNYLFYQKHPIVLVGHSFLLSKKNQAKYLRFQILFIALMTASIGCFVSSGLPKLPLSLIIPMPLVILPPYYFTYRAAINKSHYITDANHLQRLHDYPFDHALFRPNKVCGTCNFRKPARSKHCSLCGHCVAKADHHCPWTNGCLGRDNYRFFLGLLLSLGTLEVYGAYLALYILRPYLHTNSTASLFSKEYMTDFGHRAVIAVNAGGLSIAGVGLLAGSTALLPFALLAYHAYLIWAGMTTNESSKWADWRDDIYSGHVFRSERDALLSFHGLRQNGVQGREA